MQHSNYKTNTIRQQYVSKILLLLLLFHFSVFTTILPEHTRHDVWSAVTVHNEIPSTSETSVQSWRTSSRYALVQQVWLLSPCILITQVAPAPPMMLFNPHIQNYLMYGRNRSHRITIKKAADSARHSICQQQRQPRRNSLLNACILLCCTTERRNLKPVRVQEHLLKIDKIKKSILLSRR